MDFDTWMIKRQHIDSSLYGVECMLEEIASNLSDVSKSESIEAEKASAVDLLHMAKDLLVSVHFHRCRANSITWKEYKDKQNGRMHNDCKSKTK